MLNRLMEIDQTMDSPSNEDIDRVGHCQNCQPEGGGPICILCELDELFKVSSVKLLLH